MLNDYCNDTAFTGVVDFYLLLSIICSAFYSLLFYFLLISVLLLDEFKLYLFRRTQAFLCHVIYNDAIQGRFGMLHIWSEVTIAG